VSGNNLGNSNGNVSATCPLPVTGNDSGLGVVIGLGAIVLGSMLLALRRRADRAR
jgi:LPXTG-motif cell wall-anchored protein